MAIYTALPQSTNRSWNSLAIVKGKLYGSVETGGSAYIYEIDKVTGAETLKKTATGLNYRGIGNYKDTLAVVDIGGACLAYDTTDFTTVKYSWPAASGMVWTCVFGFLDNAYALKYNANSNQLGIFGSDGSVTFKTTSASTRYFSGVTLARNWIYGASQTGYIYKININTGEETQLTAAGTAAWRGLTSDTNYLYAAVGGGKIYRVNPTTGASEELTGDTVNRNWISLVWENGVIYGADNAGKIYSITLDTTVTAEYTCPNLTQRNYMGLAEVGGTLYTAINGAGIYSVNKSTGNITLVYSEVRDWRVMATVGSNLLCSQYGGALKLISPAGTLLKNFGNDAWFGACADQSDSNVAYSCCYNKASNQIAKLNISAGTVQYYTTANRAYVGIVNLGNYLYACVNGGLIYKIDKTTFTETVFCNESRAWIDMKTDGTYLYSVVNPGQVRRIDVSTGVSEIILGDPAGDNTNRPWQCLEYSSSDKAVWSGIFAYELWKLALPVPAAPTASPTTSTIYADTAVTLSCSTSGVTIKYTTDGTTPSATNGTPYSAPFTVSKTTTIKFCAIKDGYLTAGTDAVISYGGGLSNTINDSLTHDYSRGIKLNGSTLYGSDGHSLYTIDTSTGTETLVFTPGYQIQAFNIISNKILLLDWDYVVREYTMTGTLVATHTLLNSEETGVSDTGASGFFATYNSTVYAIINNHQRYKFLYPLTLGTTESITYSSNPPNEYLNGFGIVANGIYYDVYFGNGVSTTLLVRNVTSDTTIVNLNIAYLGATKHQCISDVTFDSYRLYIHINSLGIIVVNLTDNTVSKIWGSESCAVMVANSTGIYLNNCNTNDLLFIKTFLDLGTPSIYNSGSWKSEQALFVRHNSTWQSANKAFKVKNGLWTRIY